MVLACVDSSLTAFSHAPHSHKHTPCAGFGFSTSVCVLAISTFAAAALVLPGSYPYYLDLIHSLSVGPYLIGLAKFGIAFPVSYHTYNGIRHLVRLNCWIYLFTFVSFCPGYNKQAVSNMSPLACYV